MTTLKKYNGNADEIGSVEISSSLYNTVYNPFLIKNLVVAYLAQKRQGTHKTKGRSEVSGSTRKLYKQKGTGNARVGSIRSPIRRHGGVAFGPIPRTYEKKINKKERKTALKSAFAYLMRENRVLVVDSLILDSHKTKHYAAFFNKWGVGSYLVIDREPSENLILGTGNIKNVKLMNVNSINIHDILRFEKIILTEESLQIIEAKLT